MRGISFWALGESSAGAPAPIGKVMLDESPRAKVLIADDDGVTRAMVSPWPGGAGYEATAARRGEDALEVALEELQDLLLVDVTMPGGLRAAVRRVRQP